MHDMKFKSGAQQAELRQCQTLNSDIASDLNGEYETES